MDSDRVTMLSSLEEARRALASAAGRLDSEDPCLGVVARLAEAQGHLRAAARCAVRRHWDRQQQAFLTATTDDGRQLAASRLSEVLRLRMVHRTG